ncbi:MAG: hypothetical protein AAGI09_05410 [Pseudomonadota bacterium]
MGYVSITGLRLRSAFYAPVFWLHAVPSFRAAEKAAGALSVEAWQAGGVQYTLTFWDSFAKTRAYVRSPVHAKAVRVFDKIATGQTYGYADTVLPSRSEAQKLLAKKGRSYG